MKVRIQLRESNGVSFCLGTHPHKTVIPLSKTSCGMQQMPRGNRLVGHDWRQFSDMYGMGQPRNGFELSKPYIIDTDELGCVPHIV